MDAGNLYWKSPRLTAQEHPQQEEKARLMAASLQKDGIDAMLLAEGDVALGVDFVRGLQKDYGLPYVATNLDCGSGFPAKDLTLTRDGMRIGVLGVVNDKAPFPGCTVSDPQAAVREGLARLRADKVDLVVLLDALAEQPSEGLLKAVPGIDLVVGGTLQPLESPSPVPGGGLQLGPGTRGRSVGVLTFTLTGGATAWREDSTTGRLADQRDRFKEKVTEAKAQVVKATGESAKDVAQRRVDYYQKQVDEVEAKLTQATAVSERAHAAHNKLVTLDTAVADDPAILTLVDAAKERIGTLAVATTGKPILGPYVGSAACAACHPAPMLQWQGTPHARAWASLIEKKRQFDQECFSCHVTGAVATVGDVLGPKLPGEVGALVNVGCESCHGSGKDHVVDPKSPMTMPAEATCVVCHTMSQDEGRFDYGEYLPKVEHE